MFAHNKINVSLNFNGWKEKNMKENERKREKIRRDQKV